MPLITAQELIDYTVLQEVKQRPVPLLEQDILEAEMDLYNLTKKDFTDTNLYPAVPEEVKLACKKLAQYYAYTNADTSSMKGIKSESIGGGDYSYTKETISKPSVSTLLKKYIPLGKNKVSFKMRAL